MGDVGDGVVELGVGSAGRWRPVGEPAGLVEADLGELGNQPLVADLVAEAGDHGRDLGVEERLRV